MYFFAKQTLSQLIKPFAALMYYTGCPKKNYQLGIFSGISLILCMDYHSKQHSRPKWVIRTNIQAIKVDKIKDFVTGFNMCTIAEFKGKQL